jgi:hypothetical protein
VDARETSRAISRSSAELLIFCAPTPGTAPTDDAEFTDLLAAGTAFAPIGPETRS